MKIFKTNRVHSPSGKHVMTQFTIIEVFGWALRLHLFYAADSDGFHSHPRSFISVCLAGGYTEYVWGNPVPNSIKRGSIVVRSATDTHRVVPMQNSINITLAVASPVKNKWERVQSSPRIVLCGLPCSGKGTYGQLLAQRYGIPHISIGDEVRNILCDHRHPLYGRILKHIEQADSKFVPLPDDWAAQICAAVTEGKRAYILDGFPRNVAQAEMLYSCKPTHVLLLGVSKETSFIRSVFRGRSGDSEEKTLQRIALDETRLFELEYYYVGEGVPVFKIDTNGKSIAQAFADIVFAIEGNTTTPKSGFSPRNIEGKNPKNYGLL